MSDDNRKFWKESIGVRTPTRRPAPTGVTERTGKTGQPSSSGDTTGQEEKTGPAARVGTATARRTEVADGRRTVRPRSESTSVRGNPSTRQSLDATTEALGRLSIGSSSFPADVEKHLWPRPTPSDLRGLAAVAGERHRIPDEERRRLAVSAVGIRMRVEGLVRALARPVLDATILQARAVEWARVTRLAGETHAALAPTEEDDCGRDVLDAARGLLPSSERLEAEARLAAEVANTVDAILSGRSKEIIASAAHVPDIEPLVAAVLDRKLRPGDGLYIEALSAGSFARRVLDDGPDEVPLAGRVVRQVLGRFDLAVSTTTSAHARDPQSKARLAAWLRFMRDMKSRIDETMSRPADIDTGPIGRAPSPGRETASDPGSERIVVQHLRQVRKTAIQKGLSTRIPDLPEPEEDALAPDPRRPSRAEVQDAAPREEETPAPRPKRAGRAASRAGRIRRWLAAGAAGVVLALALLAASALLPAYDAPRSLGVDDFSAGFSLLDVRAAGALLIATADPSWNALSAEERRIAAGRLMSVAETRGFRAGVLEGPAGETLAVWSPGREPELR